MKRSALPKGLRWRLIRGVIYYDVPKGKEHLWDGKQSFRLGRTLNEAWGTWNERTMEVVEDAPAHTMNQLFTEWYRDYVCAELADSTAETYAHYLKSLRKAFGDMHPAEVTLQHAHQYRKFRLDQGKKVAGNRELSALSSCMRFAVDVGYITDNPLEGKLSRKRGVFKEQKRTRVPSLDELVAFCAIEPRLAGWVALKRISGMRQSQMLAINLTEQWDAKAGELHPKTFKGGQDTIYHGESLAYVVKAILDGRLPRGALFLDSTGQPLKRHQLTGMWTRAMRRYVAAGGEKFNEHDIRKHVAGQAVSLEHAQRLLSHTEPKTTRQVYRLGAERVEVLK